MTERREGDRVVLGVDVEEKSTGELQLSAGYSSLERFIVAASIAQRNFMGKGQELNAGINYSRYSKSVSVGFLEPHLFDKQIRKAMSFKNDKGPDDADRPADVTGRSEACSRGSCP